MNTIKTRLEAQITLRNRIAAEANRLQTILHDTFRPLVGIRIAKADGSFRKPYLPLYPVSTPPFKVYRLQETSSLTFRIHSDIRYNEFNRDEIIYDTQFINVGVLHNGILTELLPHANAKSDYTVEQVTAAVENVKRLQKELFEATKQLNSLNLF